MTCVHLVPYLSVVRHTWQYKRENFQDSSCPSKVSLKTFVQDLKSLSLIKHFSQITPMNCTWLLNSLLSYFNWTFSQLCLALAASYPGILSCPNIFIIVTKQFGFIQPEIHNKNFNLILTDSCFTQWLHLADSISHPGGQDVLSKGGRQVWLMRYWTHD